jgi:cell division protein FtsL
MSAAYRQNTVFFYQVLALLLMIVLVSGAGGISLVWLRQQISDTAQRSQRLQLEKRDLERRNDYLDLQIAQVQRPAKLEERARQFGLGLYQPKDGQLVALGPLPGVTAPLPEGLAPEEPGARDPYANTFDLAVMEPLQRLNR